MLCGKSQISSEGGRRAPEKLTYFDNFAMLLKIKGYACVLIRRQKFPSYNRGYRGSFCVGIAKQFTLILTNPRLKLMVVTL